MQPDRHHDNPQPLWQMLQISDVLDLEFATALAESVPVLGWEPTRVLLPALTRPGLEAELGPAPNASAPPLRRRSLPLIRGFARPPISWFSGTTTDVLNRLLSQTEEPELAPLLCTVPYFAEVAERWPGPVIYWLTDLIAEYSGANREQVIRLDRRLCRAATLVCPNSQRLASYLVDKGACDPAQIQVLPNATRATNIYHAPPTGPSARPAEIAHIPGPIAGVIGNLAGNMDWLFLESLVESTPWLSWVFVGPASMKIRDASAAAARVAIMAHPNTQFLGRQPYGALAAFARCFDVAVLPYRRCEPTYSGSSTRFYEHLAACRPILATRGLEELLRKTDTLTLVDTAEEAEEALTVLRTQGFDDGLLTYRWQQSRQQTWQVRAQTMQYALAARLEVLQGSQRISKDFAA